MGQRAMRALALGASLAAAGSAGAQEPGGAEERRLDKGRVELSTAASFTSFAGGGDSDSSNVLNVPLRVGWFVSRRVELEGELLLSSYGGSGDSSTGAAGSGRALYHFGQAGPAFPFVFAGGGVGNGLELAGLLFESGRTVSHWELGAGVKAFVGSRAAFRVEYRFTRASWGADADEYYGYEPDTSATTHRVFTGISLFFR